MNVDVACVVEDIRKRYNARMDARANAKNEGDGVWRTTKGGHKIFIDGNGEVTKGNPKVLEKIEGKALPRKASTVASFISRAKNGFLKRVGSYTRKNNFKKGYLNTDFGAQERDDECGETIRNNIDKNGNWSAKREALHSSIIDDAFKGVKKPSGQPRCVFMGGGPASGKSYVAKNLQSEFGIPADGEAVKVDPDACKQRFPEYEPKNPGPVHEESSALAKRICAISQNEGYSTLVDGTGNGSTGSMIKKIEQARAAGQRVEGRYVFMPVEDAIKLNAKRERSVDNGRLVKTHVTLAKMIPEIAGHFDDFKLAANVIGGEPKMIAHCERGGELVIDDPEMWEKVLATANYKYSEERCEELIKGK